MSQSKIASPEEICRRLNIPVTQENLDVFNSTTVVVDDHMRARDLQRAIFRLLANGRVAHIGDLVDALPDIRRSRILLNLRQLEREGLVEIWCWSKEPEWDEDEPLESLLRSEGVADVLCINLSPAVRRAFWLIGEVY
jgi:hypothetical protein